MCCFLAPITWRCGIAGDCHKLSPTSFHGLGYGGLVIVIESDFDIVVPDETAPKLITPHKVIDFICQERRDLFRDEIAERIKAIVLHQTGIAPAAYDEDKDFGSDFGMD